MSIQITRGERSPRIQFRGDGGQTAFPFPFAIFDPTELQVFQDSTLITSGFAIDQDSQAGGTVTFETPPADGITVTLRRKIVIARTTDLETGAVLPARDLNRQFDMLVAALKQVADESVRSVRLAPTDSAEAPELPSQAARANLFLGFDETGAPQVDNAQGPAGPVGPAGAMVGANNLAELANPATARSNLGLGSGAVLDEGTGAGNLVALDGGGALPAVDGTNLTGVSATGEVNRQNLALLAFRAAVQDGLTVQNMVDGIVDEFADETGIDTVNSAGQTYDGTNACYSNPSYGATSYGNSGGSGNRESAITVSSSKTIHVGTWSNLVDGSFAVDGGGSVDSSFSASYDAGSPGQYVRFDFGSGASKVISEATLYAGVSWDYGNWKWQASNDATNWTDVSATWNFFGPTSVVALTASTGYRYYQMVIVSNGRWNNDWWKEVKFKIAAYVTPADITLISADATATSPPTEAMIVLFEEDIDAVTPGTDLKAFASRDDGTTWTEMTLADQGDYQTGRRILSGFGDIGAQPSGTAMRWKITSHNNKELRLHGAALEWR